MMATSLLIALVSLRLGKVRASLVLSEKAEGGELFPGEENKVRIKLQRQSHFNAQRIIHIAFNSKISLRDGIKSQHETDSSIESATCPRLSVRAKGSHSNGAGMKSSP